MLRRCRPLLAACCGNTSCSNGLELCVQVGMWHTPGGGVCHLLICTHSSKPFEREMFPQPC